MTRAQTRPDQHRWPARRLLSHARDVREAQDAARSYRSLSIESLAESGLAFADPADAYERRCDLMVLEQTLPALPDRLRRIVRLRFWDELPQREIAEKLGISQMHHSTPAGAGVECAARSFRCRGPGGGHGWVASGRHARTAPRPWCCG
jgi:hypothetical protein